MFDPFRGWNDLLERYADACTPAEPSADFMPGVWRKIEARRGFLFQLQSYSRRLAATAAAFSALLIVLHFAPTTPSKDVYTMTYMDTLEADSAPEVMAYAAPVPALEGAQEEPR
ncbi:MAG: hypothetical protein ABI972_19700 [Acidobacteriota bacterium]